MQVVYETLAGSHSESKVMINLIPKTTLVPKEDQRFVVDAWITGEFDLDVPTYLTLAVETVERLNEPESRSNHRRLTHSKNAYR